HELRTPIAAIVSASEGLRSDNTPDDPSVRKTLTDEIHTAAERLNRLVGNLLDMTRIESGRITPKVDWCDLHDLVRSAAEKLKTELSHHTVTVDIPPDFPLVKLDFGLFDQALFNLLHNASLYSPPGSKLGISASVEGKECVINIWDDGPGFPNDALPKIFDKFYRVPGTQTGGTGLGLSISRGFVEAHRGTLEVNNRTGGGAEFTIRLPLVLTEAEIDISRNP
ncbi:MAG: ATP-binding protein, partial [Bacteroidota bacterium]